jgi:hypothetical protein
VSEIYNVTADNVPSTDPTGANTPLMVGSARQYHLYLNGKEIPALHWQAIDTDVGGPFATMTETGLATCVGAGQSDVRGNVEQLKGAGALLNCVAAPAPVLSVSSASVALTVGQSTSVSASVVNVSGSAQVQWVSSDPAVVSVAPAAVAALASGSPTTFKGEKAGIANVTASYTAGGKTVTKIVSVTVTDPAVAPTLLIDPHAVSISSGRFTTISAVVSNGLNVTDVAWSTNDASVATISANGSRSITVNGIKAGSSTYVVASYTYSGGVLRDSTLVTVTNASTAQVASITIEPADPTIANGKQVQFRVRYFSSAGAEMNAEVGSTTSFTVDISTVAQIGASTGLLTARGLGSSPVTAAYRVPYYSDLIPPKASLIAKATVHVN